MQPRERIALFDVCPQSLHTALLIHSNDANILQLTRPPFSRDKKDVLKNKSAFSVDNLSFLGFSE